MGEVIANEALCREHFMLSLAFMDFPATRPGQFVQLQCRPIRQQVSAREADWPAGRPPVFTQPELTDHEPLLRRPLCLAGRGSQPACPGQTSGRAVLEIIYRVVGTGTRWLSGVKAGQQLSLLGPLGNAFTVPPGRKVAALVGGGVGIPPMLYLAGELARTGMKVFAFCGARTADLLPLTVTDRSAVSPDGAPADCVGQFTASGTPAAIATDDGSLGFAGMVSEAFGAWLERNIRYGRAMAVYSCGPEAMMQAVAGLCVPRGIACQLALERHMACGMGTCQSCVVKTRDRSERGWSFKLCCADGPVFDARDVLW